MIFYLNLKYLNILNLKNLNLRLFVSKLYSKESEETKEYHQLICKHFVKLNKNYKSICNYNNIKSKKKIIS